MKKRQILLMFLLTATFAYSAATTPVTLTPASITTRAVTVTPITSTTPATITPRVAGDTETIPVIEEPAKPINVKPKPGESMVALPLEPARKTDGVLEVTKDDGSGNIKSYQNEGWKLTQNISVLVNEKVHVFRPLEIKEDLNIGITVVGDEVVKAPFTIDFLQTPAPERQFYYVIKYVDEKDYINNREQAIKDATHYIALDMDADGNKDTLIFSRSPYIQRNKKDDNFIEVDGALISNYERDPNVLIGTHNNYEVIKKIKNMKLYNRKIYMVVDGNL